MPFRDPRYAAATPRRIRRPSPSRHVKCHRSLGYFYITPNYGGPARRGEARTLAPLGTRAHNAKNESTASTGNTGDPSLSAIRGSQHCNTTSYVRTDPGAELVDAKNWTAPCNSEKKWTSAGANGSEAEGRIDEGGDRRGMGRSQSNAVGFSAGSSWPNGRSHRVFVAAFVHPTGRLLVTTHQCAARNKARIVHILVRAPAMT